MRRPLVAYALWLAGVASTATAQTATGAIAGTVLSDEGTPLAGARIRAHRAERAGSVPSGEGVTDAAGGFKVAGLAPGVYSVTVLRLGYRQAELPALRVASRETVSLRITLTQAPRQLSTVAIVRSPTSIDASTPELPLLFERETTTQLPTGRDATSLVALVPGARGSQLWGAGGSVANDFKLDGISVNHPGAGGDFLLLSVDWIAALDVRGIAAGAEYGNFQGGVINAITRSGTNSRKASLRTNLESAKLTTSNLNLNEEATEQAGRREISGELLGPAVRDRLFYFVAAQMVDRDVRAPRLQTPQPRDFRGVEETHRDARGLLKLSWLPGLGQRVDLLAGIARSRVEHGGINSFDDPAATQRVSAPVTFFEAAWASAQSARSALDVRIGGYVARESRRGYAGSGVPSVQVLRLGQQPAYQNAAFTELLEPSNLAGSVTWRTSRRALATSHQLVMGAELVRGTWRHQRTRNGGLTYRPYLAPGNTTLDPQDAGSWRTTGSDWGGEIRLDSDVASGAVFLQDYVALGSRLTLAPGLRFGHWAGWLTPPCPAPPSSTDSPGSACASRFRAASDAAFDPRVGLAWDVTGRNDLALKAHWGRYHQGMYTLFFDRASGANAYSNSRFYYSAPPLTDSRQTFTAAQRDSLIGPNGFSSFYDENILSESGPSDGYRQPYVDQLMLGLEKAIGPSWKVELLYLNRVNGDIVGLVDRNLATNYSPIRDVKVEHRLGFGKILDARGQPLVLPEILISNADLAAEIELREGLRRPGSPPVNVAGYGVLDLPGLLYAPDVVLSAIPGARRRYQQVTLALRANHPAWRADASATITRLRGNVAGVTGFGAAGSANSAGAFVRPNEAINFSGALPDATEFESKLWLARRVSHGMQGGVVLTHVLGERFTPTFQVDGRYKYLDATGETLPEALFRGVLGQTVFAEPRGSRHYASRTLVDLHLEWRAPSRVRLPVILAADLFNALGSDAVVSVKSSIDDQSISDPTSVLGATRQRVAPRRLRLGVRIE